MLGVHIFICFSIGKLKYITILIYQLNGDLKSNSIYNKITSFEIMIQKSNDMKRIITKIQELKNVGTNNKPSQASIQSFNFELSGPVHQSSTMAKKKEQIPTKQEKQREQNKNQIIYTQSEISKQVSKLKPYLAFKNSILTTQDMEELKNKETSQNNYKMMSELVILQNRKLCQIVQEMVEVQKNEGNQRQEKEKQGWIFQIAYRSSTSQKDDIYKKTFASGYAVMTENVEIYESLKFKKHLLTIAPPEITMVRYEQESKYDIISIEQGNLKIQCGFLNQKKMELFDRMLFLLKNMSRSTSSRLFQNQLIRSIYNQYQRPKNT